MIGSDSQAMGRVGEMIAAHLADGARDEARAARCRATARPTTSGRGATSPSTRSARRSRTGSTARSARSRSASSPTSCCGIRRSSACGRTSCVKGGMIAWAQMGDANASIPTPQPVLARPMFGARRPARRGQLARASSRRRRSTTGWPSGSALRRRLVAVGDTRARQQGRHARERRAAGRSASSRTRSACWVDGDEIEPAPGRRAADGPALLPVLMARALVAAPAAPTARFPAGRPRALGRARGGGRGGVARPRRRRRDLAVPAGRAAHRRPGRRRAAPRPPVRRRPDAAVGRSTPRPTRALPEPARCAPACVARLGRAAAARRAPACRPRPLDALARPPAACSRALVLGARRGRGRARPGEARRCAATVRRRRRPATAAVRLLGLDPLRVTASPPASRPPSSSRPTPPSSTAPPRRRRPALLARPEAAARRRPGRRAAHRSDARIATTRPPSDRPARTPTRLAAPADAGQRRARSASAARSGRGKTALVAALCRALGDELSHRRRDQRHLHDRGRRLPAPHRRAARRADRAPSRPAAARTPRSATTSRRTSRRSRSSRRRTVRSTSCCVESGGDNLTAIFSPALVDVQIFVIDVAGGDDIPRKGGPGVTRADLLVINKTDLAAARRRRPRR